jgi:hypothetical protein
MRRSHRRWHGRVWLVLPILVAIGFIAALALRPPASPEIASGVL